MQARKQRRGQSLSATRRLVLSAVFAALAYSVVLIFRFNVQFLTFDLKDAVITVAGLLLGPVPALAISVLVTVLEFITVSGTGVYGLIMNMASSVTFSVTAAVVYKYRKRLSGAIIGLSVAVVALVSVMLLLNLLITPSYLTQKLGVPMATADVAKFIPSLLLPFNAIKALTNASLVLVFYKPISKALSAVGILPRKRKAPSNMSATDGGVDDGQSSAPTEKKRRLWISISVTVAGLVLLLGTLLYLWFGLGGRVEWF